MTVVNTVLIKNTGVVDIVDICELSKLNSKVSKLLP